MSERVGTTRGFKNTNTNTNTFFFLLSLGGGEKRKKRGGGGGGANFAYFIFSLLKGIVWRWRFRGHDFDGLYLAPQKMNWEYHQVYDGANQYRPPAEQHFSQHPLPWKNVLVTARSDRHAITVALISGENKHKRSATRTDNRARLSLFSKQTMTRAHTHKSKGLCHIYSLSPPSLPVPY